MTSQTYSIEEQHSKALAELQWYKELFNQVATLGISYQRENYTCCTTTIMTGDLLIANAYAKHENAIPAGNMLVQTSARQQRLTHDFVLWIRITSGSTLLHKHPTNLASVVLTGIKNAAESPYLRTKTPEILPIIDPTTPRQVLGDGQYLCYVIERLIENASIYTPPKKQIQVTVKTASVTPNNLPPGAYTQITISDNGYGIPQHEQANLFRMFQRTQANILKNPNGAGTSLAICQLITNTIGGHITLHSQVATKDNQTSGTTVVLTLPSTPDTP